MQTSDFLMLAFERLVEDSSASFVTLFDKSRNQSHRFDVRSELGDAGTFVSKLREEGPLYFNVATQGKKLPSGKRGSKADCCAVPILWADLDLAGKPEAKKEYPTREHAEAALADMPLAPSLVVFSGGGLYPIWLLSEPARLDGKPAAEAFEQRYVKPWQALLRSKLQRYGKYAVDATHDVTRMLRVVGSKHPNGTIVDVVKIDSQPAFYDLTKFDDWLDGPVFDPPKPARNGSHKVETSATPAEPLPDGLSGSPNANPPLEKLEALLANDRNFAKAWNYRGLFESPSSYDMSIANHCVAAGWTDQEVLDAIICSRRRQGWPGVKEFGDILRTAVKETIPEARRSTAPDAAASQLERVSSETKSDRQAILKLLRDALGVDVIRWIQIGDENAEFQLEIAGHRPLDMGNCEEWLSTPKRFKARIYEATGILCPVSSKRWDGVVRGLGAIVDRVPAEDLSTVQGVIRGIRGYLQSTEKYKSDQLAAAVANNAPFISDGKVHVRLEELEDWMASRRAYRMEHRLVIRSLHKMGIKAVRKTTPRDENGKATSRSYYAVPIKFAFESGEAEYGSEEASVP